MRISNRCLQPYDRKKTSCTASDVPISGGYGGCTIIGLLPLLSMLVVILTQISTGVEGFLLAKHGILALVSTSFITIYLQTNQESLLHLKFAKSILTISYLGSLCLLFAVDRADVFCFWMAGGLLITMLMDRKLGLLVYVNLTFLLQIAMSIRMEVTVQLLITGVLMFLLYGFLMRKETVAYACVILLSARVTLNFLINNYAMGETFHDNYLNSMFSLFIVLAVVCPGCFFYQWITQRRFAGNRTDGILQAMDLSQYEMSVTQCPEGQQTSYELLNELDNALLSLLREHSLALYRHALMIGDISGRIAKLVKADEMLAKAGGLYHEIGRIRGQQNYMEETLKIAEEYQFPVRLKAILRQYHCTGEKPASAEAAIVMMTDYVVSAIQYIKQSKDPLIVDKLIDTIFLRKLNEGAFDHSGLSISDFKKIKAFYHREFQNRPGYALQRGGCE
jgi:putative nucleotidyltransferase with HDIG domain